jgi:hypothetical protein
MLQLADATIDQMEQLTEKYIITSKKESKQFLKLLKILLIVIVLDF